MRPIRATESSVVNANADTHMVIKLWATKTGIPNISRNPATPEEKIWNGVPYCRRTVCAGCSSGHTQRDDRQKAFQYHRSISNLQHILFVGDRLGGSSGRHQAVKSGYRAAGDCHEQNRKTTFPGCHSGNRYMPEDSWSDAQKSVPVQRRRSYRQT